MLKLSIGTAAGHDSAPDAFAKRFLLVHDGQQADYVEAYSGDLLHE
jgi:hypothetical protein